MKIIWSNETHKLPKPRWLVDGLIPAADDGAVVQIWGREGCGKSFLALDLACHVATGKDWLGHRTGASGFVLYICGERLSEMEKRLEAWNTYHNGGQEVGCIGILPEAVDLIDDDAVAELIKTVDEAFPQPPALIIVDTLTSCQTGVDENPAKDNTLVRANVIRLHRHFGATILIVHHANRAGTGPRGSNVLSGHVDAQYKLSKRRLTARLHGDKMNKGIEMDLRLSMAVIQTSIEPTLVITGGREIQRGEDDEEPKPPANKKTADKMKTEAPAASDWTDRIRAERGTEEWTVHEAVEITGLSQSSIYRLLKDDRVEKVGPANYRLV